jgi:hypothetical protein
MANEIPEWAMTEARECASKYHKWLHGTMLKHSTDELAGFIARALVSVAKARDERAAGIARDEQARREQLYAENGASINAHRAAAAEAIATAILADDTE